MDSDSKESTFIGIEKVKALITQYDGFPKPGVTFRDIHPVMLNPEARELIVNHLVKKYSSKGVTAIAGMESRGYYIGIPLAFAMKLPFVPLRKPKKLPGELHSVEYSLEYGTDKLEVQKSSLKKGDRVVIVDDLLATGGTASAACQLVTKCGADIVECSFLIELKDLKGISKAPKGVSYYSMLQY